MRRIVAATIVVSGLIAVLVLLFGGGTIEEVDPRCRLVGPASPPVWWEDMCGAVHGGG